jgi:hypothetical protein
VLAHGSECGNVLTWGSNSDFAPDQRGEDGRSLCFTSEPLANAIEILGYPELTATVVPEHEVAQLAVRLCDVWPDGASTLVSFGVLNLTHRESHEDPEPLVPGEPTLATVTMNAVAYTFPVGHRIRVALAPSYWPWTWPAARGLTLRVRVGGSAGSVLSLPVRAPRPSDRELREFDEAEFPPSLEIDRSAGAESRRHISRDLSTGRLRSWTENSNFGEFKLPDGTRYAEACREDYEIVEGDPLSARIEAHWTIQIDFNGRPTRVETASSMSADDAAFRVTNHLEAYDADVRIFAKNWCLDVPRDLM